MHMDEWDGQDELDGGGGGLNENNWIKRIEAA